jgi:hypothetical protein
MNKPTISPPAPDGLTKKGRREKYLAIFLISISIMSLVMTPKTQPWLILLEGTVGIIGVLLFVYARLKFWREINKTIQ